MEDQNLEVGPDDLIYFKHKQIRRFKVGRFVFKDHILAIKGKELDEWMQAFNGLVGVDKVNITAVRALRNEFDVSSVVVRGAVPSQSLDRIDQPRPYNIRNDELGEIDSGESTEVNKISDTVVTPPSVESEVGKPPVGASQSPVGGLSNLLKRQNASA